MAVASRPAGELPESVQALAEAMSQRGELVAVARAFHPEAELLRLHWGERRGRLAERFVGHPAIAAWLARSPEGVRFEVLPPVTVDEGELVVRYAITVADFRNQGTWRLALHPDGRIHRLEHQPDDLPPEPASVQP